VVQSLEQELAEFMAPLPQWLQKTLRCVALTDLESFSWYDSYCPFTADQLEELKTTAAGWQPERYPRTAEGLRPRFEQILQRCGPAQWKRYCDNAKASTDPFVRMPRGKPGAPRKDALAQEAAELKRRGMNLPQIAAALKKRGKGTINPDALRHLLKRHSKPDKI
jgi:hypothetical protein